MATYTLQHYIMDDYTGNYIPACEECENRVEIGQALCDRCALDGLYEDGDDGDVSEQEWIGAAELTALFAEMDAIHAQMKAVSNA